MISQKWLRRGILNLNQGATLNLKTISDVLLGKDTLGQSGALISLFADRWFPVYTATQLAADVPLSTYTGKQARGMVAWPVHRPVHGARRARERPHRDW
jgi:hypothetical protein